MITAALVLSWMLKLDHRLSSERAYFLAEGIAQAANEDPVPRDAAARLTAISYFESHFNLYALSRRDDPAKAIGAFQISVEWIRFPASPYHQAKTALWLVRDSQKRCGSLAQYASGKCNAGHEAAAEREMLAMKILFPEFIEPEGIPTVVGVKRRG